MKTKILLILILLGTILFAQEKKITKLLNQQLKNEIKNFPGIGDSMTLVKPFQIDENKVLSFQVSKYYPDTEETEIIFQEVQLENITGFIKDINIIFETDKDSVKTTSVKLDKNGQEISNETYYYHLFFTEINKEKNNEYFRDEILEAFSKLGYKLNSEFWAD